MVPRVKATESQNASLFKSHSARAAGSSLRSSDHRHRFEAGHLLACTIAVATVIRGIGGGGVDICL